MSTGNGPTLAFADPPGDNGTIKVDTVEFDDAPNNEPHVDCDFQIDFYGFDEGDLYADVTFEVWPPTGDGQELLTDTVFIGEDDNSGGGSTAGLDASETYTLDFTGIEPQPQQGYHVKLTINADGSQGADTKFKVFWVEPCPTPTPTPTPTPSESKTPTPTPTPSKSETHTPTPTTTETGTPSGTPSGSPTESTTSPVAVPTAVPAGTEGGVGSGAAGLAGLGTAVVGTAAGAAMLGRRRFRHEL